MSLYYHDESISGVSINDGVSSETSTYSSKKIEELVESSGGSDVIDDSTPKLDKTYSSSKIEELVESSGGSDVIDDSTPKLDKTYSSKKMEEVVKNYADSKINDNAISSDTVLSSQGIEDTFKKKINVDIDSQDIKNGVQIPITTKVYKDYITGYSTFEPFWDEAKIELTNEVYKGKRVWKVTFNNFTKTINKNSASYICAVVPYTSKFNTLLRNKRTQIYTMVRLGGDFNITDLNVKPSIVQVFTNTSGQSYYDDTYISTYDYSKKSEWQGIWCASATGTNLAGTRINIGLRNIGTGTSTYTVNGTLYFVEPSMYDVEQISPWNNRVKSNMALNLNFEDGSIYVDGEDTDLPSNPESNVILVCKSYQTSPVIYYNGTEIKTGRDFINTVGNAILNGNLIIKGTLSTLSSPSATNYPFIQFNLVSAQPDTTTYMVYYFSATRPTSTSTSITSNTFDHLFIKVNRTNLDENISITYKNIVK